MSFDGRRRHRILVCFALAPLLASNVLSGPPVSRNTHSIVIGVSNAQSGPAGDLGRQLNAGSDAYFRRVNASGGVNGRQIRVSLLDDVYEPEVALANTNQLNSEQVLFLFDYVGTPTFMRVLPLLRFYEPENLIALAPLTGAAPHRQQPYEQYVFNIRASYLEEAKAIVEHLYSRGYRRFGFLGQADAFGVSGETAVSTALAKHNLNIMQSATYRRGITSASSMALQLRQIRQSNIDAVICFSGSEAAAAFIRDARLQGLRVPLANVSFANPDALLTRLLELSKSSGIDLTNNLVVSQVLPNVTDHCPLVDRFVHATQGDLHNQIALEGWLNAAVATEALRRIPSAITRASFRQALESMSGWDSGLDVPFSFSASNHQALHAVWLSRTDRQRWISIGRFAEDP